MLLHPNLRKFMNSNARIPTVIIETESEDLLTIKDRTRKSLNRLAQLGNSFIGNH